MNRSRPVGALAALLAGAVLALAALAACTATASAAAPAKYRFDVYVSSMEKANLEQAGFPNPCKTWTRARSGLIFSVRSAREFNVALVRNGFTDSIFALMPRGPVAMADTLRYWETRLHVADNTPECSPCGPLSEYGLCTGSLPDEVTSDDCGGEGARRRGALMVAVAGASLRVEASPQADLSRCTSPRDPVVPLGAADPRFAPVTLPGATRKLLALKVGQRTTLRRMLRRGDCDRLRGPGLRTCSERYVQIKATRFG